MKLALILISLLALLLAACSQYEPITAEPVPDPSPLVQGAGGAPPDDPCLDVHPGILSRVIDADLSSCSGATVAACVEAQLNGAISAAGLQDQCWVAVLDHGVRVPAPGQVKLGLQLRRRGAWQRSTMWRARIAPTTVQVQLDDPFFLSPDCGAFECYPRRVQVPEIVIGVGGAKIQAIGFVDRGPL